MKTKITDLNDRIAEIKVDDGNIHIKMLEPVIMSNSPSYDFSIDNVKLEGCRSLILDCSQINEYDSYLVVLINSIKKICSEKNINLEINGMAGKLELYYNALSSKISPTKKDYVKESFIYYYFSNIGEISKSIYRDVISFIEFNGELISKLINLCIHPRQMRWKDFPVYFTNAGVNAFPIVFLILFLIGLITGVQGAAQLKRFGADIYIADLIGYSICRELSPLMVAILVAGRSGSAFAAEIGTMKVSEEVDALNVMGFDSMTFLVLPRVLAVVVAMPILTILADISGIVGGLIAAVTTLDVTLTGYLTELRFFLKFSDIFTGLGKSIIFGGLIATVGCFRGFQVRGGAESVGKYTTASVVTGVFLIIIADAVFTFLFKSLGI